MNGVTMERIRGLRRSAFLPAVVLLCWLAGPALADREGPLRLHLFWTNDVHGHIAPEGARFMNPNFPPPLGGGASLATYVNQVRAEAEAAGEPVLLVDVGDMFSGAPIGTKTAGDAVIAFYNALGYDLLVPGNHDFDQGRDNCKRLAEASEFPWICANLVEESTGELVDWVQPTMMIEKCGVKIGVIGIITPSTVASSFPDNIKGLRFTDMGEAIGKYRDELKAQGADWILLGIHEGLPYDPEAEWKRISGSSEEMEDGDSGGGRSYGYERGHGEVMNLMELANTVPGIDVAVGGHTHRGYLEPWIDPMNHTICVESYGNGSSIGHIILKIDRATKQVIGYDVPHDRGTLITLYEDEWVPDEKMTEIIRPYREKAEAALNVVVGSAAVNLRRGDPASNLIGVLVTDAMREYTDADFSFQNIGGLRADVSSGDITARHVFDVLPFGNEVVVARMSGAMLRRVVERKLAGSSGGLCISGCELSFDKTRPDYDRVVHFRLCDGDWDPDRVYRVAMTSFLLEGRSGLDFLSAIPPEDVEMTTITTAGAVEHYLSLHSPIRPSAGRRWVEETGREQAAYLQVEYLSVTGD